MILLIFIHFFSGCFPKVGPLESDPNPIVFYKATQCQIGAPFFSNADHQFCVGVRVMNGEAKGSGISYQNVGTVRELIPYSKNGTKFDQVKIFIEDQMDRAPEYGLYTYEINRLSRAYRCIKRTTTPGIPAMVCQGDLAYDPSGKKVVITEVFSNGYARVFFKENRAMINGTIEDRITETRSLNTLRPYDSENQYHFDCDQAIPKYCSYIL